MKVSLVVDWGDRIQNFPIRLDPDPNQIQICCLRIRPDLDPYRILKMLDPLGSGSGLIDYYALPYLTYLKLLTYNFCCFWQCLFLATVSSDFGSGRIQIVAGSAKSTGYPARSRSGPGSSAPLVVESHVLLYFVKFCGGPWTTKKLIN